MCEPVHDYKTDEEDMTPVNLPHKSDVQRQFEHTMEVHGFVEKSKGTFVPVSDEQNLKEGAPAPEPQHKAASPELTAQIDDAVKAGRVIFEPGWNEPQTVTSTLSDDSQKIALEHRLGFVQAIQHTVTDLETGYKLIWMYDEAMGSAVQAQDALTRKAVIAEIMALPAVTGLSPAYLKDEFRKSGGHIGSICNSAIAHFLASLPEEPTVKQPEQVTATKHPHADFLAEAVKDTTRKIEGKYLDYGDWEECSLTHVVASGNAWQFRFADTEKPKPVLVSPLNDDELWQLTAPDINILRKVIRLSANVVHNRAIEDVIKVVNGMSCTSNNSFVHIGFSALRTELLKKLGE